MMTEGRRCALNTTRTAVCTPRWCFDPGLEWEHLWIACQCLTIGRPKLCKMVEQSVRTISVQDLCWGRRDI